MHDMYIPNHVKMKVGTQIMIIDNANTLPNGNPSMIIKVAGEKNKDSKVTMTTHQREKNNDSDDSSGDIGSNSDDEQPSRLVQIKKKKKRTVAIEDDQ